jgi:recombination protein RecT
MTEQKVQPQTPPPARAATVATESKPPSRPLEAAPRGAAAIVPATQAPPDLKAFLLANVARIKDVAAKHLNPERIARLTAMIVSKDRTLAKCTPVSILRAVMESSRLGLEVGGALGHAYLVPYKNGQTEQYEAQFQIGYRGLIELAMRSDRVASVEAHVVWEKDAFDYQLGDEPFIHHKPALDERGAKWTHVYSVIKLRGTPIFDRNGQFVRELGGGKLLDVMSHREVMKIKGRSPAAKKAGSPWNVPEFEPEMARKTVTRRNIKYSPMSEQLAEAVDHENEIEGEILSREEVEQPKGAAALAAALGDLPPAGEEDEPVQSAPARVPGVEG